MSPIPETTQSCHISFTELRNRLPHVLECARAGRGFLVDAGQPDCFALLPEALGKYVMGLVDEEYGWPLAMPLDAALSVDDLRPGGRRHPFIVDTGGHVLAVAVQLNEYDLILKRMRQREG